LIEPVAIAVHFQDMDVMGKPPAPGHAIFPFLLGKLPVTRPNQVWAMDITYIAMARGFV